MKFTMKKTLFMKTLLFFAATVALCGMTACSGSDDNIIGDEPANEQPGAVKTYNVSIPATMPSDEQTRAVSFDGTTSTSTFKAGEKVYVYNVTKDEVMGGYLQPSNITTDGKGCDLTGTLTGTNPISANDELTLMYNLNKAIPDEYYFIYTHSFIYDGQDGTQSGVIDGATATVNVSSYTGGTLTTTAAASFQPVQSMFRFQFVDENNNPISVKSLKIHSHNAALAKEFFILWNNGTCGECKDYFITLGTATTNYIYVAIHIDESQSSGDELTFTATDADGNKYVGKKPAPSGGFKNGKYYYNTEAIQLIKSALVEPTITWTSVDDGKAVSPDEYNRYHVYGQYTGGKYSPSEITISGTSSGYYFRMEWGATIHLSNLTATYDGDNEFIYSSDFLNLDISGTNTITCRNHYQAVSVDGTLKLSGSGTLTVTAKDANRYGIYANSNYKDSNNSDASVLAATGYTVTRSDVTNNGDGTYTWTYTVTPNN